MWMYVCVCCWPDGAAFFLVCQWCVRARAPASKFNALTNRTQIVQYTYGGAAYRSTEWVKKKIFMLLFPLCACLLVNFAAIWTGFCFQFAHTIRLTLTYLGICLDCLWTRCSTQRKLHKYNFFWTFARVFYHWKCTECHFCFFFTSSRVVPHTTKNSAKIKFHKKKKFFPCSFVAIYIVALAYKAILQSNPKWESRAPN